MSCQPDDLCRSGWIEGHMFLKKPSDMHKWFRHGWLPQEGLYLTRVDCQKCHNLSFESAIRDCGQSHSEKGILLTKLDAAFGYSLKNWRFTNKELIEKGSYVVGSNRIPALDLAGLLNNSHFCGVFYTWWIVPYYQKEKITR